MIQYTLLLFVGVILGVIAQLSLKQGMNTLNIHSLRKEGFFPLLKKFASNFFIVLGFFCYGVSLLLWLVIISKLDLSYAYPMISSAYFFVALGSLFFFQEKISWKRWLAIFIIILGVILVGLS